MPSWFESWLEAEQGASMLKYWSPIIVTPIFQSAEYARGLLLAAQTDTSEDTIEALTNAKVARADILDRLEPPEVVALIDEQVLYRMIGSSKVMREQLLHIAELTERPNLCVQIVPTSVGATAGLGGDINLTTTDGVPDVHNGAHLAVPPSSWSAFMARIRCDK